MLISPSFLITDKVDEWNTELTLESLSCAFNNATPNAPELVHKWGNPLSVGVFLATTRKNAVGIALDALRTEWSLELAKFLERVLL